jgi:hypothetical protein
MLQRRRQWERPESRRRASHSSNRALRRCAIAPRQLQLRLSPRCPLSTPPTRFRLRLCSVPPSDVLLWALLWLNENTSFPNLCSSGRRGAKTWSKRPGHVRDFNYSGTAKSKLDLIAPRETAVSRPILSELSFKGVVDPHLKSPARTAYGPSQRLVRSLGAKGNQASKLSKDASISLGPLW